MINLKFSGCTRCGYCKSRVYLNSEKISVCPVWQIKKLESYSPKGLLTLYDCIQSGSTDLKPSFDRFYSCTLCGNCIAMCPLNLDIPNIVLEMRKKYAAEYRKYPKLNKFILKYRILLNLWTKLNKFKNILFLTNPPDTTGCKVYIFFGCMSQIFFPKTCKRIKSIIFNAGLKAYFIEGMCCGGPLLLNGSLKYGMSYFFSLMKMFLKQDSKIYFVCPHCMEVFKIFKFNNKKSNDISKRIYHITQLYTEIIKKEGYKLDYGRVVYHDPCYMAKCGITKDPRNILKSIGINLIELPRTKSSTFCCGGSTRLIEKELSIEIRNERVREIKDCKADFVVTACPHCRRNFQEVDDIKVLDINDLVYYSLIGGEKCHSNRISLK